MSKKATQFLILGGGLMVVLIVGAFLAAPGLIERHYFSPQERIEFHAWENNKFHLPAEALNAPAFQGATRDAATKFVSAWDIQEKAVFTLFDDVEGTTHTESSDIDYEMEVQANDDNTTYSPTPYEPRPPIDPDKLNYPDLVKRLETLRPSLDAFAQMVSQPDYSIEAAGCGSDYNGSYGLPVPNFIAIQTCLKLLRLRVYCQVHEGKLDDADKTVLLMLRATRVNPYDRPISSLIGIAGEKIAAEAWFYVVRHCADKTLLRRMLGEQIDQARRPILFAEGVPLDIVESIGTLRTIGRRGIHPAFQDKTGLELYLIAHLAEAEYTETKVLPLVRGNTELTKEARESIQSWRKLADHMQASSSIQRAIAGAIMYSGPNLNKEEADTRALDAAATLDLLSLETAKKLYTLLHGKPPAATQELVPEHVREIPHDRFGKAAPLRAGPDHYYSIGPDNVDNHCALRYDPTNGMSSAGDLFLDR